MPKILVGVKRCIDYAVKIRVKSDKKGVEKQGIKHSMNPFDEIGVEESVLLKEKGFASDVIAATCGPKVCQDVLRTALALGATAGIHVDVPEKDYELLQPIHVSKCLAEIAKQEKVDLIILGKLAIDDECNQTAQMTASLLDWPQATCCSKIEPSGKSLMVVKEIDGGLEKVRLNLPAVLSADLRLNTPRYATLPNIMKAKKISLKEIKASDLGIDLKPRIEIISVTDPPVKKGGAMVKDVDELLAKLRDLGLIK